MSQKEAAGRAERLILHVGLHKTGTSALQYRLSRSRRALARDGVLYPDIHLVKYRAFGRAHHALLHALFGDFGNALDIQRRMGRRGDAASERAFGEVAAKAGSGRYRTIILSSEAFCRAFEPDRDAHLSGRLARLAESTTLVCYVRHPSSFALSAVNTMILRSSRWSLHLVRDVLPRLLCFERLGNLSMDVLPFDRACLHRQDVVADFAHRYLDGFDLRGSEVPDHARNTTVSAEAMHVAEEYVRLRGARFRRPISWAHLIFREVLPVVDRRLPGYARPVLKPGMDEQIQRFARGYGVLRQRYGCEIPGVDYAIVGKPTDIDFDRQLSVEDLCEIDTERRRRLRRAMAPFFVGTGG